ncbi:uncharacterized protein G2W53_021194 [Senna tora]|uniref:Uncharacterized protein n=1 Tax=Senna tora TaxID=362788 RepID=A0A834TJR1_9FABA|nr:uncharacterized protein G2W53_021194 [Senna tora]
MGHWPDKLLMGRGWESRACA